MARINLNRVPLDPSKSWLAWKLHRYRSRRAPKRDPWLRKPVLQPLPTQRSAHLSSATILPIMIILIALTVAVVGSFTRAYFSSSATSTASFSSGMVDLLICDEQGQDCLASRDLPRMTDTYPGWSQQVALALYNNGSLGMKVFITGEAIADDGLGAVVTVDIYRPASAEWSLFWSGTFDELEDAEPIEYGDLGTEGYGPIMFSFSWPESETDDTATLAGKSLIEHIILTGTTQGVDQS